MKEILRKSPFKKKSYSILKIKNQVLGSMTFVLKELYSQDAQRLSIIKKRLNHNKKLQRSRIKDVGVHKDLAEFISNNEKLCCS